MRSELWDAAAEAAMGHIELARWAELVLIAPASADFLARLAGGQADDLLATLCLATQAPIAVAPAMNHIMWANAATRANVATARRARRARARPGGGRPGLRRESARAACSSRWSSPSASQRCSRGAAARSPGGAC